MYPLLLTLHSFTRWLVLAGLLAALFVSYRGWIQRRTFSPFDRMIRIFAVTVTHIQLLLGLFLYSISPVVNYFLNDYGNAVHQREIRFFGMEHSLVMITSVILITIGGSKAKRKADDREKFKTMAIWFSIGLLLILSSIPWPFSPLVSRPFFRFLF